MKLSKDINGNTVRIHDVVRHVFTGEITMVWNTDEINGYLLVTIAPDTQCSKWIRPDKFELI